MAESVLRMPQKLTPYIPVIVCNNQVIESTRWCQSRGPDCNRSQCWATIQKHLPSIFLLEWPAVAHQMGGNCVLLRRKFLHLFFSFQYSSSTDTENWRCINSFSRLSDLYCCLNNSTYYQLFDDLESRLQAQTLWWFFLALLLRETYSTDVSDDSHSHLNSGTVVSWPQSLLNCSLTNTSLLFACNTWWEVSFDYLNYVHDLTWVNAMFCNGDRECSAISSII